MDEPLGYITFHSAAVDGTSSGQVADRACVPCRYVLALLLITVQSDGWDSSAVSSLLSAIVFLLSMVTVRGVARYVADHDRQHDRHQPRGESAQPRRGLPWTPPPSRAWPGGAVCVCVLFVSLPAPGRRPNGSRPGAAWWEWLESPYPHPGRGGSAEAEGAATTVAKAIRETAASIVLRFRRIRASPYSRQGPDRPTEPLEYHGGRHHRRLDDLSGPALGGHREAGVAEPVSAAPLAARCGLACPAYSFVSGVLVG